MIPILVSMRTAENKSYVEIRDAIAHDWVIFLAKFNIIPIFIPNVFQNPENYFKITKPLGLLLTGGDSLSLDEQQDSNCRESTEFSLISEAIRLNKPIFGVCRGLQIMNRFFGGKLSFNQGSEHVANDHYIKIGDSHKAKYSVNKIIVNSYHNEGVKKNQLSKHLTCFAESSDGLVEGLFSKKHNIVAVQWHPEREQPMSVFSKNLFKDWLKLCN